MIQGGKRKITHSKPHQNSKLNSTKVNWAHGYSIQNVNSEQRIQGKFKWGFSEGPSPKDIKGTCTYQH